MKIEHKNFVVNYLIPISLAVLFLGPALKPGSIFNLDLVLVPHPNLSDGFWGIGPELPRASPIAAMLTVVSGLVPATFSFKILFVLFFEISWLGMGRLAKELGVRSPVLASVLYTTSPFLLTRISIGHIGIAALFAVLPWTISTLIRPIQDFRKLFLCASAMALAGYASGAITLLIVLVGCIFTKAPLVRRMAAFFVALLAQSVWLVPGLIVAASNKRQLPSTDVFDSSLNPGLFGLFAPSSGGGFWNPNFQIGPSRELMQTIGLLMVVVAFVGQRHSQYKFKHQLLTLGVAGWILTVQSRILGINYVFEWLASNPIGQLARESQRFAVLHLVWLVPTFCFGLDHLYRKISPSPRLNQLSGAVIGLPIAIASILSVPAIWGMAGSLEAVQLPECWTAAKTLISDNPGTTLSLPWHQYFNQKVGTATVRRSLDPMPYFLGVDVISSSNNELGFDISENGDPREPTMKKIVDQFLDDQVLPSSKLRKSGVTWVILQKSVEIEDFSKLDDDRGLQLVETCSDLDLYLVKPSQGTATNASGTAVKTEKLLPGLWRVGESEDQAVTINQPWSKLWFVGVDEIQKTSDGRISLPRGNVYVWNLGNAVVVICYSTQALVCLGLRRSKMLKTSHQTSEAPEI